MLAKGELRGYMALYLNREGLHIRDISRKAELTLPAVSKHITKGEENRLITCETKGRMKICRLNFANKKIVSVLQEVESERLHKLPSIARSAINEFLDELQEKPLIALVFGSYSAGKQTQFSDVDILLVYQRVDQELTEKIEHTASKIHGRTNMNVQPVSISYDEFRKEMLDLGNEIMKDVKKTGLVVYGLEHYRPILSMAYL